MDYILEVRVWNLGYDEVDELSEEIADLLVGRGLGSLGEDGESPVRSLISVVPVGTRTLDCSTPAKLDRVVKRAIVGARRVIVPREGAANAKVRFPNR